MCLALTTTARVSGMRDVLGWFRFMVLNNAFVLHDGFKGKAYNKYHTAMLQEYRRNSILNKQFLKRNGSEVSRFK